MAFVSSIFRLCRSSPNVPSRKRCAIRCGPALQPVSKRTQRERARRSTCRDTQHCAHPRVCERVHASTRSVGILNCTKDVVPMAALHGAAVQFEMYCILGKGLLQDATTIVVARFHCNERHCNERRWNRFSRDRYFPHDHARTQLIPLHCGEEPENGACACRSAKTLSRMSLQLIAPPGVQHPVHRPGLWQSCHLAPSAIARARSNPQRDTRLKLPSRRPLCAA